MQGERFNQLVEGAITSWREFFFQSFTALSVNGISGDYVEFGSLSGTTMWLAHEQIKLSGTPRHMWALDSFEGLPEPTGPKDDHPSFIPGVVGGGVAAFQEACRGHDIPDEAYTTIEGFYEDTLPPLGDSGPPADVALAYVDCNLYSSTVTVMEFLRPRLKHGMIVAMDDYFCWSPTEVSGERAALHEFEQANPEWHFHPFRDISWGGLSFVVERTDALG